jgi:hypothetical protein
MVGLPGFEPGTSASRTEPERIPPVLVIGQIVLKHQVKVPLPRFPVTVPYRQIPLFSIVSRHSAPIDSASVR